MAVSADLCLLAWSMSATDMDASDETRLGYGCQTFQSLWLRLTMQWPWLASSLADCSQGNQSCLFPDTAKKNLKKQAASTFGQLWSARDSTSTSSAEYYTSRLSSTESNAAMPLTMGRHAACLHEFRPSADML
jgi:hypothetical protein